MKKVLIVSYYFPPLNNIASKRYGTMCKYFSQNGYDAYILTTALREWQFPGARRDLESPVSEEKIIRVGAGRQYEHAKAMGLLLLEAMLKKCRLYSRAVSVDDIFWNKRIKETLPLGKLEGMDIVIGTYGPIGNVYAAKYIAGKLGCPYIVDVRDLIAEWQETPEGHRRCKAADHAVERMLLSHAAGITVATKGFKRILEKKYPKTRIMTVTNGWDGRQAGGAADGRQEKCLFYAGSLYEHRLESFSLLLEALKIVNEKEAVKLTVRSIGPKELDEKAQKIVSGMGLDGMVEILPSVAEGEIKAEQGRAYINVVLNSIHGDRPDQMATIPGKAYELLHERAPVLALTAKKSDLAQLVSYTEKGIASTSAGEIAGFILNGGRDYKGNGNVGKFSREYQAKRLCKFMDRILEKG